MAGNNGPKTMNFLIRRTSKKEYDGPAASASVVSGVTEDPFLVAYHKQKMVIGVDRRMHSSSSSRQSSRGLISSSSSASSSHQQSQSHYVPRKSSSSGYTAKDDQQQHPSRSQSSSSSSSSRQRRSSDKQSQRQLASGISSRRTSRRVKNHLPAHMMSSKTIRNTASSNTSHQDRHSSTRSSSGGDSTYSKSHASYYSSSSASQAQYQQQKQSIQIPMEHDGGILCLEPIPAANKSNCKYRQGYDDGTTHRFLSGGTDGTVKLWEVYEPPFDSTDETAANGPLIPRLCKTYRGHCGYVHSIAILGTFDPKEQGSRQQQMQQDQETCDTEEMDNSSFSSFSSSPFSRRSNEKKGFIINRRSNNESNASPLIKKLGRRKRDLFVTASRDNTLRIWELDNANDHEEYFEGSSDDEFNNSRKKDPLRKGKKLRGHEFTVNGGVLCVCAVPSLPSSSSGFMSDVEDDGMASAGQFVSGGSDGMVRVWDVKSALNLEKVPKSGMYHTIQLQRLTAISSHDSEASDEDESTICASIRSGGSSRGVAVAVTSLKCTHSQKSESIGLFASYADGLIRRYSPMNRSASSGYVNSAIRWCLTSIFAGHQHAVTSLTLLSSPSLLPLLSPDVEQQRSNDQTGTILISSSAEGSIRVWSALECYEKSEGSVHKRAALWEIELNDDEAGADNESNDGRDRPPTSINVRTLVDPVGVISLTALSKGGIMAAGTTDGRIRLWDVSSGLYEGTYNLGKSVQVWSLAVLSERDLYRGYDEFGELQIHNAGIIIAGDNRGRIRILRKMCVRSSTEGEVEDDEIDRIFGD
jgi:hypothetical protein